MSWLVLFMIVIFPISIVLLLVMDLITPTFAARPSRSRDRGDGDDRGHGSKRSARGTTFR